MIPPTSSASINSESFLKISHEFKLGCLPTEQQSQESLNLSTISQNNLPEAIEIIKKMDIHVLTVLTSKFESINILFGSLTSTLKRGHKVFIGGCGATGRLSLLLENIWRQTISQIISDENKKNDLHLNFLLSQVVGFMSGGDLALIKSVEDFEDHPEFGVQQLVELNFSEKDLFIGSTEGGETPWVIGATEYADKVVRDRTKDENFDNRPFFLYCNPDEVLKENIIRSENVLKNEGIRKINLFVGPMTITGSTRMQASTILMHSIGLCLMGFIEQNLRDRKNFDFKAFFFKKLDDLKIMLEKADFVNFLSPFIEQEYLTYEKDELIIYETKLSYAMSVLTDTTERSPTFSLQAFENQADSDKKPSKCYLLLRECKNVVNGWKFLLGDRNPRTLDSNYWAKYKNKVGYERLIGYDFSENLLEKRSSYNIKKHHYFKIENALDEKGDQLFLQFDFISDSFPSFSKRLNIDLLRNCILDQNFLIKILLNSLSTLIMGKLRRYESNIMTYVKPTNNKLIDRSIRYISYLLKDKNIKVSYENVCHYLFEEIENLQENEAIVLKVYRRILEDENSKLLKT